MLDWFWTVSLSKFRFWHTTTTTSCRYHMGFQPACAPYQYLLIDCLSRVIMIKWSCEMGTKEVMNQMEL